MDGHSLTIATFLLLANSVIAPAHHDREQLTCGQVCEYNSFSQKADCSRRNLTYVPSSEGCEDSRRLILDSNHIGKLSAESFLGYKHLQNLQISNNSLSAIHAETFSNLRHLKNLDLSHNTISALHNGTFTGAESLRTINLNNNTIQDIHKDAFLGLSQLQRLHLSHNKIRSFPPTLFHGLYELQYLALDNNILEAISNQTFQNLTKLRSLSLVKNKLTELPYALFRGLPSLQEVVLSGNELHKLPPSRLLGITSINRLYFDQNDFKTSVFFASYLHVTHEQLNIGGNPFECDCDFKEIQEWHRNISKEDFLGTSVMCSIGNISYDLGNLLPFNCNKYSSTFSHSSTTPAGISPTSDQSLLTNDILTTQPNDEKGCDTTGWKIATALLSLSNVCTVVLFLFRARIIPLFQQI